jgi:hypothetical protein
MVGFTSLELAVFAAISAPQEEMGDKTLADLLASARVQDRDLIGHGFFTAFGVDRRLPALAMRQSVIHGPDLPVAVRSEVLQMGFVLWVDEAGYPECLEGFRYTLTSERAFDLEGADLAKLAPANDGSLRVG